MQTSFWGSASRYLLPLSCGKDAVKDLLCTWTGAVPVSTFRSNRSRTWIVVAPAAPMDTKFQHAMGLAYIQPARPFAKQSRVSAPRFVPAETPKEPPSWLKSWAGVAQSRPTGAQVVQASASASQMDVKIDAVPSPTPIAFQPLPSSVAVHAEDSAILSALKAMEQRLTALATDVSSLQREVHQKDTSASAFLTDRKRSGSRTASRQRGRVPVGKRLHIG